MSKATCSVPADGLSVNQENKSRPILFSAPMVRAILAGTKTQTRRAVKTKMPELDGLIIDSTDPSHVGSFNFFDYDTDEQEYIHCPYGQPGDRLWVRETWIDAGCGTTSNGDGSPTTHDNYVRYVADDTRRNVRVSREVFDAWLNRRVAHQRKYCPPEPTDIDDPEYFEKYQAHNDWLTEQFKVHHPSIFMPRWASRITLEIESVRVERLQDISEADAIAEGIQQNRTGSRLWRNYGYPNSDGSFIADCEPIESYATLWESINGRGSWDANPWVWVVTFRKEAK